MLSTEKKALMQKLAELKRPAAHPAAKVRYLGRREVLRKQHKTLDDLYSINKKPKNTEDAQPNQSQ